MDSLVLNLILSAACERLRDRRLRAVWRSRRADLYLSFEEEIGLHLAFADPVAVCVQAFPRRLPRVSDEFCSIVAKTLAGRYLTGIRWVPGERIFRLCFGEDADAAEVLVSLVPSRAGALLRAEGVAHVGPDSLWALFESDLVEDVRPLLGTLSAAPPGRLGEMLAQQGRRLPKFLAAELASALHSAESLGALQRSLAAYVNGRGSPAVHRVSSDLPPPLHAAYLAPFPYSALGPHRSFEDIEVAASYFLGTSRVIAEDARRYREVLRFIRSEATRVDSAEEHLAGDHDEAQRADRYQLFGQALLGVAPETRQEGPVQGRWYDDIGEHPIEVPLVEGLDARASAGRYFELAKKCRRAATHIRARRRALEQRREELGEMRAALAAIQRRDDLDRLARRLPTFREETKPGKKEKPRRAWIEFDSDDGLVLVGRTAAENMVVTFCEAAPHDLFFHAQDVAGSHVILRLRPGLREASRPAIIRAAELAAYHSKARKDTSVDVCYTQRKFVRKIKGGILGQVRLERFQTVRVSPTRGGAAGETRPARPS